VNSAGLRIRLRVENDEYGTHMILREADEEDAEKQTSDTVDNWK